MLASRLAYFEEYPRRVTVLVTEQTGISAEMAVRLSKVFGGRADTWLLQQAHYDLAQIPAETIQLARLRMA